MADEIVVAALVRKRAELAGRIVHARAELDGMLASLAALDATLRLFDASAEPESIRPTPFCPSDAALRLCRSPDPAVAAGRLAALVPRLLGACPAWPWRRV